LGFELPTLIDTDKELAHDIEEIHETLGKVGYGLIALHATAALGHHYIKKDDTLKRMLRFKE
jgi:cytochrome b561